MTKYLAVAAALAFAGTATAQDAYEDTTETPVVVSSFDGADINADGGLDRAEYQAYVETEANLGNADAFAIAESGDYDTSFITRDTNADGLVTSDELVVSDDNASDIMTTEDPTWSDDDMTEDGVSDDDLGEDLTD